MRQAPEVEKGWVWKGVQGRQGVRGVVVEAGTSTPILLEYDAARPHVFLLVPRRSWGPLLQAMKIVRLFMLALMTGMTGGGTGPPSGTPQGPPKVSILEAPDAASQRGSQSRAEHFWGSLRSPAALDNIDLGVGGVQGGTLWLLGWVGGSSRHRPPMRGTSSRAARITNTPSLPPLPCPFWGAPLCTCQEGQGTFSNVGLGVPSGVTREAQPEPAPCNLPP